MRDGRWRPFFVAVGVATATLCAVLSVRRTLFAVAISGSSMQPAFAEGDCVLVLRRRVARDTRSAGLVACVRAPDERLLFKRIVGVPGDSLRVGTTVEVAGRTLIESYAHGASPSAQFRGVAILAPDEYFVLGDNRAASTDSRDFGPVPAHRIEGVAWLRYWPLGRIARVRRATRTLAPLAPPT